jgi:peptidoglycan/xylan/chitin deacetylase (PgdA/CDA1 family)
VSLTYDDAVASQRGNAVRQLAARALPGTFFLTGKSEDLALHRAEWEALVPAGHELASHTMHHPCDCSYDWVPKGYAVQDYDLPRMRAELLDTVALLRGLGATEPYTFAYPCGETRVGTPPQSYEPLVARASSSSWSTVPPRAAAGWCSCFMGSAATISRSAWTRTPRCSNISIGIGTAFGPIASAASRPTCAPNAREPTDRADY